ncbi:hypothetical protein LINPERPRIM_LOCUS40370 [Linum perenne]
MFLQAKTEELVTADNRGEGDWGNGDASVFEMRISGRLQGEFQVTNGYGSSLAPQVMRVSLTFSTSFFLYILHFRFVGGVNRVGSCSVKPGFGSSDR